MFTRREACLNLASLTAIPATRAWGREPAEAFAVSFDFASGGRGSLLIPARINGRAALLLLDTGSSHTILRASAAGVNSAEVAPPVVGPGVIGDAVGQEVTLEVGGHVSRRRVAVMDLSRALSMFREKIDGLLGLDFLLGFSRTVIDLKARVITFFP
jgi:predicted aspartyl protease